jgi:hypothetical protein
VLIDKDPGHGDTVTVRPPTGSAATLERMTAPSINSPQVSLSGRSYPQNTSTGTLGTPRMITLRRGPNRTFTIWVPGGSAALLNLKTSAGS